MEGGPNPTGMVSLRKGDEDTDTHKGKTTWGLGEKMAIYGPRRELPEGTNPTCTLILGFQPTRLQESRLLLFKPPHVWCFAGGTLENKYNHVLQERAREAARAVQWARHRPSGSEQRQRLQECRSRRGGEGTGGNRDRHGRQSHSFEI